MVELMTPERLADYLKTMRDAGCASARLVLHGDAEVAVVFLPTDGPLPGEAPTPGGWKSPSNLDRDPLADEERSVP